VTRRATVVLAVAAVVGAVAFGLLDVRRRARVDRGPRFHRTDFTVYLAAAAALDEGRDPYEATNPRGWRYVYPPFLAIAVRPLRALAVPDAALAWDAVSAAVLAAGAWALARAHGPAEGPRAVAVALLVAAPFLVQSVQRGQVTVVLLGLHALAVLALLRGRDVLAGLLLALGVALRLTPLLVAGMVGLACLAALRREGGRALAFPAAFAGGLAVALVAVPVVALGPARAWEVSRRWLEVGRDVYAAAPGELADFSRAYAIDEWSFKNQSVRRVAATTLAAAQGDPVAPRGRPAPRVEAVADRVALGVAAAAALLAVVVALRRMRERSSPSFRRAFAVGTALPALVTRYVWPVHLVTLVPLLAECARRDAGRRRRVALAIVVGAVALFYAAHVVEPLRPLAEHGVLLVAIAALLALEP
jgi:hypothetical protein